MEPDLAAVCENWSDEAVIELEKGTGAREAHVNAPFQQKEGTKGLGECQSQVGGLFNGFVSYYRELVFRFEESTLSIKNHDWSIFGPHVVQYSPSMSSSFWMELG